MTYVPPGPCASCDEGSPRNECPSSKRPCGHHCNHSWSHEKCCWCGAQWGEGDGDEPLQYGAVVETCDEGHHFGRLTINGVLQTDHRCPVCLAIGLKRARKECDDE